MEHSDGISTYGNRRQSVPSGNILTKKEYLCALMVDELRWNWNGYFALPRVKYGQCSSRRSFGKDIRTFPVFILKKHCQIGDLPTCLKILPTQVR